MYWLTSEVQFQCKDITALESILSCNLSSLYIRELLHSFLLQIFHMHPKVFVSISLLETKAKFC